MCTSFQITDPKYFLESILSNGFSSDGVKVSYLKSARIFMEEIPRKVFVKRVVTGTFICYINIKCNELEIINLSIRSIRHKVGAFRHSRKLYMFDSKMGLL